MATAGGAQREWRRAFERAFSEGRYAEAAAIYQRSAGSSEKPELVMHAAEALTRVDPPAGLGLLLKLKVPAKSRAFVERSALLGHAYSLTRDFDAADAALEEALEAARRLGDPDLIALVGYYTVQRYLWAEDRVSARRQLEVAREGRSAASRIRALAVESYVLGFEERVREQAERIIELLRQIDPQTHEHMPIRATVTTTLALAARDLYLPEAIPEIERALSGVAWPADFAHHRFKALRTLGWVKAFQGDYFNAFRHFKAAADTADATLASTPALKVLAACDRAALARSFGEHRWSRVELDGAEQLAERVEWHTAKSDESAALTMLAELFAEIDPARAAMYMARYREVGEAKSPFFRSADPRSEAFALQSAAAVEIALGNTKVGVAHLRKARTVFERFGYDVRVARCLIDEYKVTRDRELLPLVEERLRNYRQSWLWTALQNIVPQSEVELPPMQRRVFDEICAGRTPAEIAKLLNRSEYTISNHLKEIYKAFNVNNRSALVAEAVRRGLVKTGPRD